MPLPEPNLDNLRFQKDLVDEARRRIVDYCPEWTNYNVSDPGIAMLELFAWMTELIVYRLNQVPEKNYINFLNMIGVQLRPPVQAQAELTFWLSAALPLGPEDHTKVIVPKGTEVATWAPDEASEIIFTTDEEVTVLPPQLKQLRCKPKVDVTGEVFLEKNYLSKLATEDRSSLEDFYTFSPDKPQVGDAFYIGFDDGHDLRGHILRLTFWCDRAQGTGVSRSNPPLVWEYFGGDGEGQWLEIEPSKRHGEKDTTGGLNNEEGEIVFYLPLSARPSKVHNILAYWLRCTLQPRDVRRQGEYNKSPLIKRLVAHSIGITTLASHASIVAEEELGRSTGEGDQRFNLRHTPVLSLQPGETVEVEEGGPDGQVKFMPWELVANFAFSDQHDRHFSLDPTTGEVAFGPVIRQPDGKLHYYGQIPKPDRRIRFTKYRYGGGTVGNVPKNSLEVLKNAVPYIDQVLNLAPAWGGRDQESLAEAKLRARREMETQNRAVTARDYERLTKKASPEVRRVKCQVPSQDQELLRPGMLDLLIVPDVAERLQCGDLSSLALTPELKQEIWTYLNDYRVIATLLEIKEPDYVGIKVAAKIVSTGAEEDIVVANRAEQALQNFISPLLMVEDDVYLSRFLGSNWDGWSFGQDLHIAEIFSMLQQVPGIKHVLDVQVSQRPVFPLNEPWQSCQDDVLEEEEFEHELDQTLPYQADNTLIPVPLTQRVIAVPDNALICSLEHEVEIETL